MGPFREGGPNLVKVEPRRVGPFRVGAPKGGGRRVWGPKFRAFFPSPTTIFFLSSLSWGSFRGILVVFEGRNPEMCTFGLSGCRVKEMVHVAAVQTCGPCEHVRHVLRSAVRHCACSALCSRV